MIQLDNDTKIQSYNSEGRPIVIEVDLVSHVPIYTQIVEQIKQLVASGALEPGDQLPTVRQLAADLRVNFNTVARAYRLLDEAGVISTQQGRGTYVLETASQEASQRLRAEALTDLARSFVAAGARLGFEPDHVEETVMEMLARWRRDGIPPEDGE
jgi:GntR family transcriptional regulator